MRRMITIVLCLVLALSVTAAVAGVKKPSPPQSNAYGASLEEWMKLYWTWGLGGPQADHVRRVAFLPIPAGEYVSGSWTDTDPAVLVGQLDWTCRPGTPFVLPVACWIGELYTDGSIDPPLDPSVFTESDVVITLNGRPIIDSMVDDLGAFYWGPVYFDSPIWWPEPTPYGSVAAVYVQGIGFVHPPLSRGGHTLTLESEVIVPSYNYGVQFVNSWTITVAR